MTHVHYNLPPELARAGSINHGLCVVCLMFAKGDQVVRTQDVWRPLVNDGNDREQKWISYEENTPIREAVTVGFNDFFPGVLLSLCWDHLGAIAPPDPAPLCNWCKGTGHKQGATLDIAKGPLPPGLNHNGGRKQGRG